MDQNSPLVTAVIPVYNHERYVAASISSLIDQTYTEIELIVINDGSRDDSHRRTLELKERCEERFVRFIYICRENKGLAATLNEALELASGEFFSILASDDIALPNREELLVGALSSRDESYAAAFGDALLIDGSGERIALDGGRKAIPFSARSSGQIFSTCFALHTAGMQGFDYRGEQFGSYPSLLCNNYLPAMSTLVRTRCIREVGGWTDGNTVEDWELWRKLAKRYRFVLVDQPVACYRWHESNSVKTVSDRLNLSTYALLGNEREYCEQRGLTEKWRRAQARLLLPVLWGRRIPLRTKLELLYRSELTQSLPYLTTEVMRRLSR